MQTSKWLERIDNAENLKIIMAMVDYFAMQSNGYNLKQEVTFDELILDCVSRSYNGTESRVYDYLEIAIILSEAKNKIQDCFEIENPVFSLSDYN